MTNLERQTKFQKQKMERSINADFSLEREPDNISFSEFEQNPETAVMLYHMNSGNNKFEALDDLDFEAGSETWDPETVQRLIKEIQDEVPTKAEQAEMLKNYFQAQGRGGIDGVDHQVEGLPETVDCHILTCGTCGVRHPQRGRQALSKVFLWELVGTPFEYSPEDKVSWEAEKQESPLRIPFNANGDWKKVDTSKLRSAYDSVALGRTFHMHPEMVVNKHKEQLDAKEFTFLCQDCLKCKTQGSKPPPNSIAAGVDFGDYERIGLVEPSLSELCLIARVRNYLNCVKVSDNKKVGSLTNYTVSKIRGHAIAFRHTAPIIASLALLFKKLPQNNEDCTTVTDLLTDSLTVHLLGSKGKDDEIARLAIKELSARPFVVYQWLSVLQKTHRHYQHDPPLPPFQEFVPHIDNCNKALFENAEHISNKEVISAEKALGDDVSHVRTGISAGSMEGDSSDSQGDNDPALSHSYIIDEHQQVNSLDEKMRNMDNAERAAESLEALASAFNIDISDNLKKWHEGAKAHWKSERESDPVNEFDNAEELLVGSYPHIFMYGKGYPCSTRTKSEDGNVETKNRPINQKQIQHLLLQYTAHAARSHQVLYYLFDHEMRHSFMKNLSARIKNDPSSFQQYAELLSSPEWKAKIVKAGENPTSKVAKEVLSTILPILNFGNGDKNIMGSIGDAAAFSRAAAMMQRYGSTTLQEEYCQLCCMLLLMLHLTLVVSLPFQVLPAFSQSLQMMCPTQPAFV